jgi:hypothetical protein
MMQPKPERPQRGGREGHDDDDGADRSLNNETDAEITTDEKSEG